VGSEQRRVRVRVKAPCRRRANGPVSCLYGIILYYPVSCVFGPLILLSLCAGPLLLLALSPHPLPLPFPSSPSLDCTRSASLLLPTYSPTHLPAYQPPHLHTHPQLLHVHNSTTCCHPPSPACVLLPSWPLQLAPSHSSAVGRPSAFASPPPPNILAQTTPMAARHPRARSRALQPKVRLAVLRTGSVSTMASATTRPTTSTAGTAALTRTGTLQAAPPTCALTVRATMRFCDHALIESRHESCWR
jgi:hypothetical protein